MASLPRGKEWIPWLTAGAVAALVYLGFLLTEGQSFDHPAELVWSVFVVVLAYRLSWWIYVKPWPIFVAWVPASLAIAAGLYIIPVVPEWGPMIAFGIAVHPSTLGPWLLFQLLLRSVHRWAYSVASESQRSRMKS